MGDLKAEEETTEPPWVFILPQIGHHAAASVGVPYHADHNHSPALTYSHNEYTYAHLIRIPYAHASTYISYMQLVYKLYLYLCECIKISYQNIKGIATRD